MIIRPLFFFLRGDSMEIKEFCESHSTEELQDYLKAMDLSNKEVVKKLVSPDNICTMVQALQDDNVLGLNKEILTLSVIIMTNLFNAEIIQKELFRREMENE